MLEGTSLLPSPHLPFLPFHKQGLEALLVELLLLTVRFIFRFLLLQAAPPTLNTRQEVAQLQAMQNNTASVLEALIVKSCAASCYHLVFFLFLESLLFQDFLFLFYTLLEPAQVPICVKIWFTHCEGCLHITPTCLPARAS